MKKRIENKFLNDIKKNKMMEKEVFREEKEEVEELCKI